MANSTGFFPDFLETTHKVALPKLKKEIETDLAPVNGNKNGELKYPHFSAFLSASRKFPYFTATNIDGSKFKKIARKTIFPSGTDQWVVDDRAKDYQWGPELYKADKSDFQRGHMTKREDPQWGTDAQALNAAKATFHFANCVPQVGPLNTKEWGKLETYILEKRSVPEKLKVCVMTGPVLDPDDPIFVTQVKGEDVQIPVLFWKIVYYTEDGKNLSRAGFLMGQQKNLFANGVVKKKPGAEEAVAEKGLFQDFEDAIYQVRIDQIEKLSGLKFAPAKEPFKDSRPIKLIVKQVQVPTEDLEQASPLQQLAVDQETGLKFEYEGIKL